MNIIFAGTPDFAAEALRALVSNHFNVVLVLTQPDRPKGRGLKLQPSAVKVVAEQLNIPVAQPETLKSAEVQAMLASFQAGIMVVAAYGLILPESVLTLPRLGCLNIHASLLPRWRGAAPIQRAIEAGDKQTGVGIMQMDKGLDTGAVLFELTTPIFEYDTAQTLHDRLAILGGEAIVETLSHLPQYPAVAQSEDGITYAQKLTKNEAQINWQEDAEIISRKIRAFNPVPGAWTFLNDRILKIWMSSASANQIGNPGEIVDVLSDHIMVGTGKGVICISELQLQGGKKLSVKQFLQGHPLHKGQYLGEAQ
ncbi:methionyl-tRNA formyltransferase [Neisseria sp. Ec49-e6-T10]|uniref:methionyl-tRNA formyltransferase n=1 Tax=Neisseria sp. Ec49-e6-T10 TaxID=3140744 RepID=UPI003EB9E65B